MPEFFQKSRVAKLREIGQRAAIIFFEGYGNPHGKFKRFKGTFRRSILESGHMSAFPGIVFKLFKWRLKGI
jgi:hypothetical protein